MMAPLILSGVPKTPRSAGPPAANTSNSSSSSSSRFEPAFTVPSLRLKAPWLLHTVPRRSSQVWFARMQRGMRSQLSSTGPGGCHFEISPGGSRRGGRSVRRHTNFHSKIPWTCSASRPHFGCPWASSRLERLKRRLTFVDPVSWKGVIVLLAYDEFLDRQDGCSMPQELQISVCQEQQNGQPQHRESSAWNRYHCKVPALHGEPCAASQRLSQAVAALCEGLPAITVLACAWWSLPVAQPHPELARSRWLLLLRNYPPESPLMKMSWHYERPFLGILGSLALKLPPPRG